MKGIILYFSGTGNTKFIANKIAEEFYKNGCEIDTYSIEEKIDLKNVSYDYLILGFPKYFEYIPKFFIEYLEDNLSDTSKEIKTMIFSTGRDRAKTYFNELEKKLLTKNYRVIVTKNFQMPDNYTLSKGYKKLTRKDYKEIFDSSLVEIKDAVVNFLMDNYMKENVNEIKASIYKTINKMKTKDLYKNSVKYSVNSDCDKCNLCVKICPTKNIDNIGGDIKFRDNCIMCCRCVNACPKNSIMYNEKEHYQYKENIDLIVG
ncbi:EFR1 family ferrodoxin [Clostridium sp. AL.422]|uniref:EFR1 family ferrodoxin n=1 Tax=Clostridium TaxID=1485 RepID=UPI00293DFB5F|nr:MULTISPECIES: EFR1 family ferrodoxin [unclassified Clostridium]MDV4152237.1 EFR1 family ferrodoxin [Clostridium sp. AL.422]